MLQGLGDVFAGFLIGWAGVTMGMQPGSVPEAALFRLGHVAAPCVGVALILPLVAMARYDITRKRHGALRVSLDARLTAATDAST